MTFLILPSRFKNPECGIAMPSARAAGWYKMEAVRPDGSRRLLADWFPNLITNGGLNQLGVGNTRNYCQVGSGSTPPSESDSSLASYLANTNTVQSTVNGNNPSSPYYAHQTRVYRFGTGVAAGNLSEVGVGWSATANLFSRALILDGGGSPTTITVLSDEVLDVTYQLRVYPPEIDHNFSVIISGVTHTCVSRAAEVDNNTYWDVPEYFNLGTSTSVYIVYNGVLGALTGRPTGLNSNASSIVKDPYAADSRKLTATITFGLNGGNVEGGISAMWIWAEESYQISFSPAIAKDNTKTLTLNYEFSWARKTL